MSSGQPVARILVLNDTFRRGLFADRVGDINVGERLGNVVPYWFDPAAFAPPAAGTFGNSGRAPFRQPGCIDGTLLLEELPSDRHVRLQIRADLVNAFDQRQWLADPAVNGLDNSCTFSTTAACSTASDRFGQLLATRAAREIQLGIKLYW